MNGPYPWWDRAGWAGLDVDDPVDTAAELMRPDSADVTFLLEQRRADYQRARHETGSSQ